jgi:adenine-specific DNA-methyltransferase
MAKRQKLELNWIGKDKRPRLEPRILVEEPALSHAAPHPATGAAGLEGNLLIQGDNLLALKALEATHVGKVKCCFIDPPYNTGSAFEHYDDGLEHSLWLTMMRDRLELIHRLLSQDGAMFVQVDDNEGHYLKVLCDEIFGRTNFIATFLWRKVDSPNDNKVAVTPDHEFIFGYARDKNYIRLRQKSDAKLLDAYNGPDTDGRYYRDRLLKKNGKNSLREDRPSMFFPIMAPDGKEILPIHDDARLACWSYGEASVKAMIGKNLLIWKNRGSISNPAWTPYTREYAPAQPTRPFSTLWVDLPTTRQTKAHQKELFGAGFEFSTPKPEALIERVLQLSTNPGDLVLDSFAGSGTTGAVAHKMGRRWVMVELGEHAKTHIVPRLRKVIDGTDKGGVTEAAGWTGGGGYRFMRLAPSLLEQDGFGQWVIAKSYDASMLAQAVCRHMGFTFSPSGDPAEYWKHGSSSERDFIFVTTQTLTHEACRRLSEAVGEERSLLVCCRAFGGAPDAFANLTLAKIPTAILQKCEWSRDDYSLHPPRAAPDNSGGADGQAAPRAAAQDELAAGE